MFLKHFFPIFSSLDCPRSQQQFATRDLSNTFLFPNFQIYFPNFQINLQNFKMYLIKLKVTFLEVACDLNRNLPHET